MTQGRRELIELLARHGRSPSRRLGQHFLADPNIVRKIVHLAAVGAGDRVLEIGAGTGTLTRGLADTGCRVLTYEVDEGLRPVLAEALEGLSGVEVRFEDASKLDFAEVLDGEWTLVANLPYNVGTPILLDLLRSVPQVVRFVVMVQREVADRLTAPPGGKSYGLPSVIAQLHADVGPGFTVPAQVFVPPPGVASAVVNLVRKEHVPDEVEPAIELAAAAFGRRRKMLRSSLVGAVPDPHAILAQAGIDERRRAESLSPEEWLQLARAAA
jgi:16S rRNA (adenine1518-N6/adenine1519-N6)-dimethyltransferase